MASFICPVCSGKFTDLGRTLKCEKGHCFDKSKFDYVNLLMSNASSDKRHGDDRLMIRSRRDFLSKGYYSFLLDEICDVCNKYLPGNAVILDAGCGECYYSGEISKRNPGFEMLGIDISKDALEFAHKRGIDFPLAVGSLFNMPVEKETCDCVLNCFSPKADDEFHRVLKNGGILIRIVPLEEHLFSLKAAIYEKPYLNEHPEADMHGFKLLEYREIRKELKLNSPEDVTALFKMTPYYYKTGREDQQKLEALTDFTTCAAFGIQVYGKEA